MNVPCIVELDLHRHLHPMDWRDAQDDRAQEFQEERRRYRLEDRPGLRLVTAALSMDEPGYPLDESLFALLEAWRLGSGVMDAAGHLVVLVREQAERMARQWAGRAVERDIESAQDSDEDLPW